MEKRRVMQRLLDREAAGQTQRRASFREQRAENAGDVDTGPEDDG